MSSVKRDWKLAKAWLNLVLPTALAHDSDRFNRNGLTWARQCAIITSTPSDSFEVFHDNASHI